MRKISGVRSFCIPFGWLIVLCSVTNIIYYHLYYSSGNGPLLSSSTYLLEDEAGDNELIFGVPSENKAMLERVTDGDIGVTEAESLLQEVRGNLSTYEDLLEHVNSIMNTHCPMDVFMNYRIQHQDIESAAHDNQRISLFYSAGRGLGDKVVSAVTTFYTAMLSNRAFKMVLRTRAENRARSNNGTYSFMDVYNSPWIDLPLNGNNTLTSRDKDSRKIISFFPFQQVEKYYSYDYYQSTNFTAEHTNHRLLHWMVSKGSLHSLLDNPNHKDWFQRHKLHSGNAFGCAMQFLFQPSRETFQHGGMASLWTLFRNKPSLLKIGMQIRVGDRTFDDSGNNNTHSDDWIENIVEPFVSCAKQIEDFSQSEDDKPISVNATTRTTSHEGRMYKQSVWFITSDSEAVLEFLTKKYPQRVISLPSPKLEHTAESSKMGMQSAVQDHVLLGLQDYAVVYDLTSFGRSGALRQLKYGGKHLYQIKRGQGTGKDPLSMTEQVLCGPNDYARWEQYSTQWIGI